MCQMIEELLTEAARVGFTPINIRLGAVQMRLYEQWTAEHEAGAPMAGADAEYAGLPVIRDVRDSYRGLTDPNGEHFVLA